VNLLYDATPLLLRSAGVKNYHYALLTRLLPRFGSHRLTLFPFLDSLGVQRNERSNFGPLATAWRFGAVLASNYLHLPLGTRAARHAHLFHVTPHLQRPPSGVRLTSMVHDPTPLLLPEFHTPSNIRYFEHFTSAVLPKLAGVIVPSRAVARDLVERLHVPENRITVIPHGVGEEFFRASGPPPAGLPERYILSLGALEPRKNLVVLLDAYQLLPEELRRQYPLVVAGATGWKNDALRHRLEADRPLGVQAIGYVPSDSLPTLYAGAAVFVFPSLYEGFGMPLLEAMAAGTPVVASNVSAMPEVVGQAGLLVDPHSPAELARSLEQLLTTPTLAARLTEAGLRHAREFTWDRAALATKAFFEAMAG
jgi:alpha-1,3-rhamnosyl/mannosyltransferase